MRKTSLNIFILNKVVTECGLANFFSVWQCLKTDQVSILFGRKLTVSVVTGQDIVTLSFLGSKHGIFTGQNSPALSHLHYVT